MNLLKRLNLILLMTIFVFSCEPREQMQEEVLDVYNSAAKFSVEKEYKGSLEIVMGDVKRAFGRDQLSSKEEINNLVKGFKYGFKVDGIRIPIYPEGTMSKKQRKLLHYLIAKCKAEKLLLFANPIGHKGGVAIANGERDNFTSVQGNFYKNDKLVQVIKDFSEEYEVDFISPFNEDARPRANQWTAEQTSDIYARLHGNVNGAKLLGADSWGLPGGIEFLDKTDIAQYIDISVTHNLGFNHDLWPEFIAKSNGLPVWDSETTKRPKNGKVSRIQAAIDAGVNGLVLYKTWKMIDFETGELSSDGESYTEFYLK